MIDTTNMFNGMFGKVGKGMCRISINGGIAIKTTGGYKTYNVKTGKLTNCSNLAMDIGEDLFFVIPTNKVAVGDIIIAAGKPKCVVEVGDNKITVLNYEDSTIETIVPERHVFMGNTYFYGKIVSMFGDNIVKGKQGFDGILKYMMLSELMKGNPGNSGMNTLLPLMMMNGGDTGGFGNLFDGLFDSETEDSETEDSETEAEN